MATKEPKRIDYILRACARVQYEGGEYTMTQLETLARNLREAAPSPVAYRRIVDKWVSGVLYGN